MSIESIVGNGRALIARTFLDRARILDRSLSARDSTGGQAAVFTERPRVVVCRFAQLRDEDPTIELDSIFGRSEMKVMFPIGTQCAEGDMVKNVRDGALWQIVKDLTVPSELQVMVRYGIKAVN